MRCESTTAFFPVKDYDLGTTLNSGQAFRWEPDGLGWVGVVGTHWVRLESQPGGIAAQVVQPVKSWDWLAEYLQVNVDLETVLATFPADAPMRAAVAACRGLRLLRQPPWECLASFILSSNNQIRRIRHLIHALCERYGQPVHVPVGYTPTFAFPSPERIATLTERELRRCKVGFRAPYLLAAAKAVATRKLDLETLGHCSYETARRKLLELPGVGPKIADCVLLFAYGLERAFPVDVWIKRALCELYFSGRSQSLKQIAEFGRNYFGPFAGYAQQYLYHYIRTCRGRNTGPGLRESTLRKSDLAVPQPNHIKCRRGKNTLRPKLKSVI